MKEKNFHFTRQELLALKEIAEAIVRTVNTICDDYDLATDEAVSLNEAEHATLFGNADSPFANCYSIRRCLVYKHPTEESTWVICRGSLVPLKVSPTCSPPAAAFLRLVFSDSSLVAANGLVLQNLVVAGSKSFLASVCYGSNVSGPLYIPD